MGKNFRDPERRAQGVEYWVGVGAGGRIIHYKNFSRALFNKMQIVLGRTVVRVGAQAGNVPSWSIKG